MKSIQSILSNDVLALGTYNIITHEYFMFNSLLIECVYVCMNVCMNVYSNEQCEKRTYVLRAFPTALYIYILYAEEAQNMPMTSYKTKFKM